MNKLFGRYKENKKGSMELSINAIVILVMAMAVLALGLGIIKGIRSKSTDFLEMDVDVSEEATPTKPIANFKDEVSMGLNKETTYTISVYSKNSACDENGKVYIECVKNSAETAINMNITHGKISINAGEPAKINFIAEAQKPSFTVGNYFCDLKVDCGGNITFPFMLKI
jgi:hypothetical protein